MALQPTQMHRTTSPTWHVIASDHGPLPIVDEADVPPEQLAVITKSMVEVLGTEYAQWVTVHGSVLIGNPRPRGIQKRRQPALTTSCYSNAGNLAMGRGDLTYTEGFVLMAPRDAVKRRFISPFATLSEHAWCTSEDGTVIDVTYDRPETGVYVGVALVGGPTIVARTLLRERSWGPWGPWADDDR